MVVRYEKLQKATSHMLATKLPPSINFDEDRPSINLLYRPIAKNAHTFYGKKLGFCCDRVREHSNFSGPSKNDFLSHMEDTKMAAGSPYISMRESPGHVYRRFKNWADQVALTDYLKLKQMGIAVVRAPDLAKTFRVRRDWDVMGWNVYLAESRIPANCIIAILAWLAFEKF
jgi:hypothetical protein